MADRNYRSVTRTAVSLLDAHRLGLDIGARRIGVALAHADRGRATPLTTVQAQPQQQALTQILKLIAHHHVIEVVIGLPLTLRGEHGPQAQEIERFAAALRAVSDCPLVFFDERLTSAAADQMMREFGIKPARRKEMIDRVAAAIILQDYLDARAGNERRARQEAGDDHDPD